MSYAAKETFKTLQVDALIEQLHARGFEIAVETNGMFEAPAASTGSSP